jgi:HSP20 family protein
LTISGEKEEEKEETGKTYYRAERSYGRFTRTIDLPSKVMTDKVEAKEHLGMLETTLPKMERAKTKKITVKAV